MYSYCEAAFAFEAAKANARVTAYTVGERLFTD
jgi:hypothetical protein